MNQNSVNVFENMKCPDVIRSLCGVGKKVQKGIMSIAIALTVVIILMSFDFDSN